MSYRTFKRSLIAVTILSLLFLSPEVFGQFRAGSIHLPGSGGTPPTSYRFFTKQSATTAGWALEASATSDRLDVYLDGTSIFIKSTGDVFRIDGANIGLGGAPSEKLHVVSGHLRFDDGFAIRWPSNTEQIVGSSSGHTVRIDVNSVQAFTVTGTYADALIGFKIGSGAEITKHLSATASLDYAQAGANACETLTLTVTGAADGNPVSLGTPHALANHNTTATFYGWVSATDTVSVRRCVVSADGTNPAAATVRASVNQY
jgi:hypothetical protein